MEVISIEESLREDKSEDKQSEPKNEGEEIPKREEKEACVDEEEENKPKRRTKRNIINAPRRQLENGAPQYRRDRNGRWREVLF